MNDPGFEVGYMRTERKGGTVTVGPWGFGAWTGPTSNLTPMEAVSLGLALIGRGAEVGSELLNDSAARANALHGALIAIDAQVRAIDALPWWRRRKRRLHWLAIRDTLTVALDEGMVTRGSRVG